LAHAERRRHVYVQHQGVDSEGARESDGFGVKFSDQALRRHLPPAALESGVLENKPLLVELVEHVGVGTRV
jgi:hypothetical protein